MYFWLAFFDPALLADPRAAMLCARYPRLRLVSLAPLEAGTAETVDLPDHVRSRVVRDPSPEFLAAGDVTALLTDDPAATAAVFTNVSPDDIVTWESLPGAYETWMHRSYLPRAARDVYTPDGLLPAGRDRPPVHVEIVGSCGALQIVQAVPVLARELNAALTCSQIVQNHPTEHTELPGEPEPALRLVVPPLRYMHPATLDDFVRHPDKDQLLVQTIAHLTAYLDSVLAQRPRTDLYVCGFIEPYMNPLGIFMTERTPANFKYFVRCLNDAIVTWSEQSRFTHFVDADEIAAAIGKLGIDEGPLSFYSHRAALDIEYDDNTDALYGLETVRVRDSFDIRSAQFACGVLRQVLDCHVIRSHESRVKAVVVDLDNTLWRGLATDDAVGPFNGRPQGLIEALHILKARGILIAVASKNDETYIRARWDEILYESSDVPLTIPLSLDDFDAVRIDLRSKATTVGEILGELNVLPQHAVFIDDNANERAVVQAAFPAIRVLGAELNRVRSELIHSPFTQLDAITEEDRQRSRTIKRHAQLARAQQAGQAQEFLESLRLSCRLDFVDDSTPPHALRAIQLLNKTNQWTLNGLRSSDAELTAALADGARLVCATVQDAYQHYGLVAVAMISPGENVVARLAVSCRVIGMGIDDALISELLTMYGPLTLAYTPTDRNHAATAAIRRWTSQDPDLGAPVVIDELRRPSHVAVADRSSVLTPCA